MQSVRKIFSGKKHKSSETPETRAEPQDAQPPTLNGGLSDGPLSAAPVDDVHNEPATRRVVQAPALSESGSPKTADAILIKAEPSPMGDQCKFMVNRDLFEGYSWWFPDLASAEGSPLAEALFGLDEVETVLVHESTLTLTRKDKNQADWRPLAKQAGAAIRSVLQSGSPLIAEKIIRDMPSEDDIREEIQEVIDMVVNPGVAGHGGNVSLLGVKGNTVTIAMGGGCQGCSSASYTLKVGIHNAFRKAIPTVGAILDETDHAAGLNPYYS